jgi:hypothetical protein
MRGVGMIESLAIDVLGVFGQMMPDRRRQIGVRLIRHGPSSPFVQVIEYRAGAGRYV